MKTLSVMPAFLRKKAEEGKGGGRNESDIPHLGDTQRTCLEVASKGDAAGL